MNEVLAPGMRSDGPELLGVWTKLARHRGARSLGAPRLSGADGGEQPRHAVEQRRERAGSLRWGFDAQAAIGPVLPAKSIEKACDWQRCRSSGGQGQSQKKSRPAEPAPSGLLRA